MNNFDNSQIECSGEETPITQTDEERCVKLAETFILPSLELWDHGKDLKEMYELIKHK